MAEALANRLGNGRIIFVSAGTFPSREVHPLAVQAMAEEGIDIAGTRPKCFTQVPKPINAIIAVCGQSKDECPTWPGLKVEAWDIDDPAMVAGTEEEQLLAFRAARNQLRELVNAYLVRHEGDRQLDSN
jgi:arsenate reductase